MDVNQPEEEGTVTKNQRPDREKIIPLRESALRSVQGGVEEQHVDNPGQTPMKDGPA